MTAAGPTDPQAPTADNKVEAQTLELRTPPRPVTRINRKVLIGAAAVVLLLVAGLVLVALRAPSLRVAAPQELFNVDHKPIADALSRLPATYEGVQTDKKLPLAKEPAPGLPKDGSHLAPQPGDADDEAGRAEKARLARLAVQARESQVFFRLQLKPPPKESAATEVRPDALLLPPPPPTISDDSLTALSALRAAKRALALAGGDPDGLATGADRSHKLTFLKARPEKNIYNPHPLSRVVGKYDNIVAFGQERALVVWQRIILPDGSSIVIDNLPATDTGGYAGLADQVDFHTWKLLKGVALATMLWVGSELVFGSSDSDLVKALQQSTQATTNRAGQRLIERQLNVQPTITVRPGWPLRVIVHKDIVLRPYRASTPN